MVDWCSLNDGTKLNAYDMIRKINNALRLACLECVVLLNTVSKYMYLILPGWVLPVIENGSVTLTEMPVKRFWAVQLQLAGYEVITMPFPKQSVDDMWRAFIAPVDYYINNSEYWPYYDEDTDTVKQGIQFTPVKKFGVFQEAPSMIKDIGLILVIIAILEKLGLLRLIGSFVNKLLIYYKEAKVRHALNKLLDGVHKVDSNIDLVDTNVDNGFKEISSQLGVRLLLR